MGLTEVTVDAKVYNQSTKTPLLNTNIKVKRFDLLEIDVNLAQTWFTNKYLKQSQEVNANGISVATNQAAGFYKDSTPSYEYALCSLVGTLDNGKTYFPIGSHLKMVHLGVEGTLSLTCWGGDYNISEGQIKATVSVQEQFAIKELESESQYEELSGTETSFDVHAYHHSITGGQALNTNIQVEPGDLLTVRVHPKDLYNLLTNDPKFFINANGLNNDKKEAYADKIKGPFRFVCGSLIGTIDNDISYFPIGTNLEMTILNKGTLSLYCWDVDQGNNLGSVKAFVKVVRKGIETTQIVNIDGKTNTQNNPVVLRLTKGTYTVTPIGTQNGGNYNAWNPWFGSVKPENGENLTEGWLNSYFIQAEKPQWIDDGQKYKTDLLALANAKTAQFTLLNDTDVKFSVLTDYPEYCLGGISLEVKKIN
ncbi:hypothetical protein NIES4103_32340 [Nostoc sp. NIES-4103]|nr:hypothetical protein NIES4103_32340 [Nostoc sp. NIES-4103]